MSTAFPWERLLGPSRPPREAPAPPLTTEARERAILRAVRCGSCRTKNAIWDAVGGRKDATLRAIDALEARGALVRGARGYEIPT